MKSIRFLTSVLCLFVCMLLFAAPAWAGEQDYAYYYDAAIGGAVVTSYTGSEAHVTVPDTLGGYPVRKMEFGVFNQLSTLLSVTLPDTLASLDGGAFYACYNLQSVRLPENLTEFPNSSAPGQTIFYVNKDCATAKLMLNDAGVFPSSRFVDPEYPDMQFYYVASAEPELGLYKYTAKDEENVTIPDGVMHIYNQAFVPEDYSQNAALKEIHLPDSVVSVGMQAFVSSNTPNLEAVYLSDNIAAWGSNPFNGLFNLRLYCSMDSTTARTFPNDSAGPSGFVDPADPDFAWKSDGSGGLILARYYGSAKTLVIPDSVTQIGNQAFYNNKTLTSVTIPDSVTKIGGGAFDVSDYWSDPASYPDRTIYLPDNAVLGNNPFDIYRTSLIVSHDSKTAKDLMRLNDEFGSVMYPFYDPQYPDYLIAQFGGETYMIGYTGSDTVISVPPICDVIEGHVNLSTPGSGTVTHITVPEGVTRLDERAFFGWPVLKTISLPSTLKEIGEYAFSNTSLSVLIIPDGVTSLPAHMTDNSIIRYITIPASVTSINDTALITSGSMRTYKIYCNKGSYAEKWAKAHSVPVGYLEDGKYSFYVPEQFIGDIGDTIQWRSSVVVAPVEPDFAYTITASSSNPSIVSVEGDTLRFNGIGQVTLTFTSPELGYSATIKEVHSYKPVESFSVPEYVFAKYRSTGTISVSNVMPVQNTNPVYRWQRPEQNSLGSHTADIEAYKMYDVNRPGPFKFTVTAHSGVSRSFTFVHYEKINSAVFSPFSGRTAVGMTVQPEITVTVDDIEYKNISATYTLTSSNTSVAKPTADGKLELIAPGTAVITAKFLSGTTAKQTITVADERIYTISAGVKTIEKEAFLSCPATIITIPASCISIGERAFADCASLYLIKIPESVKFIAENAFDGCSDLTIIAPVGSYAEAYAKTHGFAAGEE